MKFDSIIISGPPVSGKSTLAKALSTHYAWKTHSVGSLFKERWRKLYPNQEISFEEYWKNTSLEENKLMDQETRKLFESQNLIGDFRYSIHCKDLNVLLVLATADLDIRAERASKSGKYKEKTAEEIRNILIEREQDELNTGKKLYGPDYDLRDPKNYHIALDLGKLDTDHALQIIKSAMIPSNKKIDIPEKQKIYFACSIRGGRDHAHLYPEIVDHLKNHGEVLTEYFASNQILEIEKKFKAHEIFAMDIGWINESNTLVAEVSTPSLGVGFEIATALNMNKKVLCLFKNQDNRPLSEMISGNKNIHIIKYDTLEEAKQKIDEFFSNLKNANNQ